jgi:hypothetical protein
MKLGLNIMSLEVMWHYSFNFQQPEIVTWQICKHVSWGAIQGRKKERNKQRNKKN